MCIAYNISCEFCPVISGLLNFKSGVKINGKH